LQPQLDNQASRLCESIDSPSIIICNKAITHQNLAFNELNLSQDASRLLAEKLSEHFTNEKLSGQHIINSKQYEYCLLAINHQESDTLLCTLKLSGVNALSKRYSNLVNAIQRMSEGVVILNAQQKIDFANQSFYKLFPYFEEEDLTHTDVGELLKQALAKIIDDKTKQAAMLRLLKRKISTNAPINLSFKNKDNRYIEYRDNISDEGERIGLFIDESSIMFLHEQLELAYTESLSLSKAKSSFMAAMSHEVKTPLNAMIGILDLCMMDEQISQLDYVSRLNKSAHHLLRLVNDVLDYTKFDAERVSLNPVECDLRELFEQCISENAESAQVKNAELLLYIDPQLPQVFSIDDIRLMQVLNNLIGNALKFGNKKTNLVSVSVQLIKNSIMRVSVSDNGIGIAADKLESIFENFTQASDDIHRTFGGTGLGLSICKQITTLMNGHISVKSEEGKGSRFVFEIPIKIESDSYQSILNKLTTEFESIVTDDKLLFFMLDKYKENIGLTIEYNKDALLISHDKTLTIAKEKAQKPPHNQSNIFYISTYNTHIKSRHNHVISKVPLKLSEVVDALSHKQTSHNESANVLPQPSTDALRELSVLFVEDNPDNLFVLKEQARTLDLDAQFAQSVNHAYQLFTESKVDIVITDYQMQGETGADLIRLIRQYETDNQAETACKIYVLTADKTQECEDDCSRAGMDALLMKPISVAALNRLLMSHSESVDKLVDAFRNEFDSGLAANDEKCLFSLPTLVDVLGSDDLNELNEFLLMYTNNSNQSLAQLNQAAQSLDYDALGSIAHSMKSSFKIIGNHAALITCEEIEAALASSLSEQQVSELIKKVNEQHHSSVSQVQHWMTNAKS
jgi:signal transduction histidine kinase/CheY-like chemotaxis protein